MKHGLKLLLAALVVIGVAVLIVYAFIESRKELQAEQELERPITSVPRVSVQDGEAVVSLDTLAQLLGGIEVFEVRENRIPDSAVVHLQGKEWVYLKKDAQTFVRKEISPARPLKIGDQIVVTGAQLILSEEFRAQISSEE